MKSDSWSLVTALALGTAAGLAGCADQKAAPSKPAPTKVGSTTPPSAEGHDHPHDGPHGEPLIELGNEQYHAELVHDEKGGTVTVYLLDGSGKKAAAIDAKEVTINLKHDGKGEQFKLAAQPETGDPEGKSSRFTSNDKELLEDLDKEGNDAQLVVEVGGEQLRAKVAHDHDHEGHSHDKK